MQLRCCFPQNFYPPGERQTSVKVYTLQPGRQKARQRLVSASRQDCCVQTTSNFHTKPAVGRLLERPQYALTDTPQTPLLVVTSMSTHFTLLLSRHKIDVELMISSDSYLKPQHCGKNHLDSPHVCLLSRHRLPSSSQQDLTNAPNAQFSGGNKYLDLPHGCLVSSAHFWDALS